MEVGSNEYTLRAGADAGNMKCDETLMRVHSQVYKQEAEGPETTETRRLFSSTQVLEKTV